MPQHHGTGTEDYYDPRYQGSGGSNASHDQYGQGYGQQQHVDGNGGGVPNDAYGGYFENQNAQPAYRGGYGHDGRF